MLLNLVPSSDPVLREVASAIDLESEKLEDLQNLMDSMLVTMHEHEGIGLAAPQVGLSKRMFIMEIPGQDPVYVINPKIESLSKNKSEFKEGCLSFPQQLVDITRPAVVEASFINYEGKPVKERFSGIAATCFQHEYDHINGITILDHLEDDQSANEAKPH